MPDLKPLADLIRDTLGPRGMLVLGVLILLGVAFFVMTLGAEAATAWLRFVRACSK